MITADLRELIAHRVEDETRQSCWKVQRTFTWRGHKIRATVKNDAYSFQSDYFAEVFSPTTLTWNRVYTASNDAWHKDVDALKLATMDAYTWDSVELLIGHLVAVAQDLLEDVDA